MNINASDTAPARVRIGGNAPVNHDQRFEQRLAVLERALRKGGIL